MPFEFARFPLALLLSAAKATICSYSILAIVVTGLMAYTASYTIYALYMLYGPFGWQRMRLNSISMQKKARLDDLIETFSRLHEKSYFEIDVNKREMILEASAGELVRLTTTSTVKYAEVMLVYVFEAIKAHQKYNCLTEAMFDDAYARSVAFDLFNSKSMLENTPILLGVPISVKDVVSIRNVPSSIGLHSRAFTCPPKDSSIITALLDAGAIPFCKTNVPQSMLSFECSNPLLGRTLNPVHPSRTCGGSSGGEAALISSRGSPIGIGSDIGGSLRIPAHFCGINGLCALKPSHGRISTEGFASYVYGFDAIKGVAGPLARCVDDLARICIATIASGVINKEFDHAIYPFIKTPSISMKKLTFGYMDTDGILNPSLACRAAVHKAKAVLESQGHTTVPYTLLDQGHVKELTTLFYSLVSADGCHQYLNALQDEPLEPCLRPFFLLVLIPQWLRKLLAIIANKFDSRISAMISSFGKKSIDELYALQHRRNLLAIRILQDFQSSGIDALIYPAHALPATRHNTFGELAYTAQYTFVWNVIDWSVGVVPVGFMSNVLENVEEPDRGKLKGLLDHKIDEEYNMILQSHHDLPVSVQIICPPHHEEATLYAMRALETAIS